MSDPYCLSPLGIAHLLGVKVDNRVVVIGWGMFLLCGLIWIGQAASNSDWIGLLIGAIWVVGCGFFLWDLKIRKE